MVEDWVNAPEGPGWFAFEGSEWESKPIYLKDGVEYGEWQKEWLGAAEEHWHLYKLELYPVVRYIDVKGEPFQTILDVKWVHQGMSISNRKHSGPHRGEPVLGFMSNKHRWNHALYGIDTLVGKWWRLHLPWEA